MRKPIRKVRIKQRNTPEGISKICGIWFQDEDDFDLAKIDLCEGGGQWRVQTLAKFEHIIGFHYYVNADDEHESESYFDEVNMTQIKKNESESEDSEWLDSFGFIVYRFAVYEKPKPPPRPRGRPGRKVHLESINTL